jgi:hypothetical protein
MKTKLGKKLQAIADEEWCLDPLHRIAWRKLSNGNPGAIKGEFVDHDFSKPVTTHGTGKGQLYIP